MKVLLDECIPRKLKNHLIGHSVATVPEAGFAGASNGELLRLVELAGFEVLVTIDRGIEYQQNLRHRTIAVVLVKARRSRFTDLMPFVSQILQVMASVRPGQLVQVGP